MAKRSSKKKISSEEKFNNWIIEQMEKGNQSWLMPWVCRGGLRLQNGTNGNEYKGSNIFSCSVSKLVNGHESPFYATWNQIMDAPGACLKGYTRKTINARKKGGGWYEKETMVRGDNPKQESTPIIFFKRMSKTKECPHTGEEKTTFFGFYRLFWVYNYDQIEGMPLCKTSRDRLEASSEIINRPFNPIEACEGFVEGYEKGPDVHHEGNRAFYAPRLDYIQMPKHEQFLSDEGYYSTLFHEMVHSTGHSSRLDRGLDKPSGFRDEPYAKEELIAEMGAALLCAHAGIEAPVIENQAAYLRGWAKKLKAEPRILVQAGSAAYRAVNYIRGIEETYNND